MLIATTMMMMKAPQGSEEGWRMMVTSGVTLTAALLGIWAVYYHRMKRKPCPHVPPGSSASFWCSSCFWPTAAGKQQSSSTATTMTAASAVAPARQVRMESSCDSLISTSPDWLIALEQEFHLSQHRMKSLVKIFIDEMRNGLEKEGQSMKMLPSYLYRLPSGKETGSFLAVDLGGSNLRVIELVLDGHGKIREKHTQHEVPDDIKTGQGEDLFEFMAQAIEDFLLEHHGNTRKKYVMGFTFSFPIDQTTINQGRLMHWNKGYSIDYVVGENVVALLQAALERRGLDITIAALVNDTVGTMMAHSYAHTPCAIGVIIGTGTNAAYIENLSEVKKWKGKATPTGKMIINMEWGNFDRERRHLPMTSYDEELDEHTPNQGLQPFEKMVSGMYLGELVRLIVVDYAHRGVLFAGQVTYLMEQRFAFDTKYMTEIDNDPSFSLERTRQIIQEHWSIDPSIDDRHTIRRICQMIVTRSARLSAIGIGGIITKLNAWNDCTVAIDGSVFEHYPGYSKKIRETLEELFGMLADNVHLVLAKDGSGVGAALCAAVSHV
jgi:hexokinase